MYESLSIWSGSQAELYKTLEIDTSEFVGIWSWQVQQVGRKTDSGWVDRGRKKKRINELFDNFLVFLLPK